MFISKEKGFDVYCVKPFITFRGVRRDRTADTRIFSPLLYQLSYRTIFFLCPSREGIAKISKLKINFQIFMQQNF